MVERKEGKQLFLKFLSPIELNNRINRAIAP